MTVFPFVFLSHFHLLQLPKIEEIENEYYTCKGIGISNIGFVCFLFGSHDFFFFSLFIILISFDIFFLIKSKSSEYKFNTESKILLGF